MDSSILLHSGTLPTGHSYLAVITKRSYRIRSSSRAAALQEHPPVVQAPHYVSSQNPHAEARLVHDSDVFCVAKPFTDVVLRASAHSVRGNVVKLDTAVQVGSLRRSVRVWGDRCIRAEVGGRWSFSPPEPFTVKPIVMDDAYGGRDVYAEKALRHAPTAMGRALRPAPDDLPIVLTYPRNGAGRGYCIDVDPDRFIGQRAPDLEDPSDPVSADRLCRRDAHDWLSAPSASGYGPIDVATFPRAAFLLPLSFDTATGPIPEIAAGSISAEDMRRPRDLGAPPDPRLFSCAAPGLGIQRLRGGERVTLVHLHPAHERLEFEIPRHSPRMRIEPPNAGARDLLPLLQTVLIEPDDDRLTLTWVGRLDVAAPFSGEMLQRMGHRIGWESSL
jgi:hypothetical protein